MAKQQAVLEIVVEEGDLLRSATASRKAILDLKDEQTDLNKAFKQGKIDVEEYAKQSVILEQKLKKEQATYGNLTKAINTNANSLDGMRLKLGQLSKERGAIDRSNEKQIKDYDRLTKEINQLNAAISKEEQAGGDFRRNVGNYGSTFKEAAQQINIAGTNVGSLTTQLTSFINPATAAVGILSALGAAYARSTIGAKDLAFVQNQLAEATTIVTNSFARLFSSSEDGEGFFTNLLNHAGDLAIAFAGPLGAALKGPIDNLLKKSKELALITEKLEDLQRAELELRNEANDRLSDNQELLTDIQSDQTEYNEKIEKSNKIIANIRTNQAYVKYNLQQQLELVNQRVESDEANELLLDAQLQIKKEIAAVDKDAAKRAAAIERLQDNLTEAYKKQNAEKAKENQLLKEAAKSGQVGNVDARSSDFGAQAQVSATDYIQKAITAREEQESKKRIQNAGEEFRAKIALRQREFNNFSRFVDTTAQIFDEQSAEYKLFATSQALIDTYRGATAALAPPPVGAGPLFGPLLAAATIALGLKNVAKINGFAEGGWTGAGSKYDVAGVVHKDEYVAPKKVVNNPMAQPHLAALERMRGGYADGGFVQNTNTLESRQNLAMMNAIKNMPSPIVSVKEITRTQNRVQARENAVTLQK